MTDKAKFKRAHERMEQIKGFYIHLAIFILVIAILAIVDFSVGEGWWVQWVILGWGAGVLCHAILIFGKAPTLFSSWEKRKIKELMDKEE